MRHGRATINESFGAWKFLYINSGCPVRGEELVHFQFYCEDFHSKTTRGICMRYVIRDAKYRFHSAFDTVTGAYVRTGILDDSGNDTGIDPFMVS